MGAVSICHIPHADAMNTSASRASAIIVKGARDNLLSGLGLNPRR
jgi:hypothetical protein